MFRRCRRISLRVIAAGCRVAAQLLTLLYHLFTQQLIFFAVCIALFILDRGFYIKEYPSSSLFYREVKPFLSWAQLLFLTRQSLFCRDQKARNPLRRASKPCFFYFSLNFSRPILGYSSLYSAISACQILFSPELFLTLRKKSLLCVWL